MKYVDEFRDGALARGVARSLSEIARPDRDYRLMEFCGGHTHAISRYGLEDLLPEKLRMIHGPGCPVCVLPVGRIDAAIRLARRPKVTLCTYADLMRVHPRGRDAGIVGRVVEDERRFVQMTPSFGGARIVDWLAGEQLPRIC